MPASEYDTIVWTALSPSFELFHLMVPLDDKSFLLHTQQFYGYLFSIMFLHLFSLLYRSPIKRKAGLAATIESCRACCARIDTSIWCRISIWFIKQSFISGFLMGDSKWKISQTYFPIFMTSIHNYFFSIFRNTLVLRHDFQDGVI